MSATKLRLFLIGRDISQPNTEPGEWKQSRIASDMQLKLVLKDWVIIIIIYI